MVNDPQRQLQTMRIIRKLTRSQSVYRLHTVGMVFRKIGYNLPLDRELLKYGLKPDSFRFLFYSSFAVLAGSFLVGYCYKVYTLLIYQNTLMALRSNNALECQQQRLLQIFKNGLMQLCLNWDYNQLIDVMTGQRKIAVEQESMIRMVQYRNYKKNRNPAMDFLSIGEMIQYPFPNIQQEIKNRDRTVITSMEV